MLLVESVAQLSVRQPVQSPMCVAAEHSGTLQTVLDGSREPGESRDRHNFFI
jgi:hypothetical protein